MRDAWTCPYCGLHSVVPSLNDEHMAVCVARPAGVVAA